MRGLDTDTLQGYLTIIYFLIHISFWISFLMCFFLCLTGVLPGALPSTLYLVHYPSTFPIPLYLFEGSLNHFPIPSPNSPLVDQPFCLSVPQLALSTLTDIDISDTNIFWKNNICEILFLIAVTSTYLESSISLFYGSELLCSLLWLSLLCLAHLIGSL